MHICYNRIVSLELQWMVIKSCGYKITPDDEQHWCLCIKLSHSEASITHKMRNRVTFALYIIFGDYLAILLGQHIWSVSAQSIVL